MSNFKKVKLTDFFDILPTNQDDKINFQLSNKNDPKAIPFVGRTNSNNGVVDYAKVKDKMMNKANVITIALDGSTGSAFYQHVDFLSGQNIWILKPKSNKFKKFNALIGFFCVTSIRKSVVNYSYNLGLTKTRLSNISILLKVKDNLVDVEWIENFMSKFRNIKYIINIKKKRLY